MKTVIFFQTEVISNKEIETFILAVSQFKDIKCNLSAFDVDSMRKSKPVLATLINNKIEMTDIFSYDEIANISKEGYRVVSVDSLENYAKQLATTYKYC